MSLVKLWHRLRSSLPAKTRAFAADSAREAEPVRPPLHPDAQIIVDVQKRGPGAVERALEAFERLRRAGREEAALEAVLELERIEGCPVDLGCLAARLLFQRGELDAASRLVHGKRDPRALVLLADVAAARERLAEALDLAERALAYDIDSPEARERLKRWRPHTPRAMPGADQPTLLSKDLPETTLRIVAELGRGGAATVYRAEDDVLGRHVALKVYHQPELDRDKLVREARLAVSLAMPGVVRIFDANPEHGWIAMEWVERGTLSDLLKSGAVRDIHPGAGWFFDLTRVVAHIHERGFVHADLKPANVLFKGPSEVVVSDFGLAVPLGGRHLGSSEGYVSPERLAGASASALDDVFCLGRILRQALTALDASSKSELSPWLDLAERLTSGGRPRDAGEVLAQLTPATPGGSGGVLLGNP